MSEPDKNGLIIYVIKKNLNPEITYRNLVDKYFSGSLKPPFNIPARNEAGFSQSFYMPLVGK